MQECDPGERPLSSLKRLEPPHRPWDPLAASLIWLHTVVEIFDSADHAARPMLRVVAVDGRFVGRTAIDRDLFGPTMPADRLGQATFGGLLVALLREEQVNRVALLIHGAGERTLWPLDLDGRRAHPPAHPHGTRAAVERLLAQWAVC